MSPLSVNLKKFAPRCCRPSNA